MPFHRLAAVPVVLLCLAAELAAMFPLFGAASPQPSSKCQRKCGSVDIPYPFGIVHSPDDDGDDDGHCAMNGFGLTCNETGINGGRHRPFAAGNVEVVGVSLQQGQARMLNDISYYCYNTTTREMVRDEWSLDFAGTPYMFSDTTNKFTVIGCQTLAYINGDDGDFGDGGDKYMSGCVAMCRGDDVRSTLSNGSCSGIGCCQTAIPKGLQYYHVEFDSGFNTTEIHNVSRCSYAVLMDSSSFTFSTTYATSPAFINNNGGQAPFVVDWAIGNETCDVARKKPGSYACFSNNTECFNSLNGPGYICNCSKGFHGNPYLHDPEHGCKDIDECKLPQLYRCTNGGVCRNRLGGYDCPCKFRWKGHTKAGTCIDHFPLAAKVAVGAIGGILLMSIISFLIILYNERKKMKKFYKNNGGPLLEEATGIKIFKKGELDPFLKNSNIIGKGGFGKVYKGLLDNKEVAIKKPINGSVRENEQFANEVIIQSHVIHKNIVRLIGCCLEVEAPLLVYEFISQGSLHGILHNHNNKVALNLETRLNIAAQSADGLAYLHSKANIRILHGDVKPKNILLDDNFVPKISDFGISRLLARDKEHTGSVIGDMNYMDPLYRREGLLTEKSDVYSFGFVILELISGRRAIHSENNSLLKSFLEYDKKKEKMTELFDKEIAITKDLGLLDTLAGMALKCLSLDVDERPTMMEIAEQLLILSRSRKV
ncbi:wall-associated receptor kinase 5-like [Triticum dicoccoides]|uniref:wall-associated receptor kinase 5-like n=2 Tax=Triticum dicoccoides TaxID=85692 RepID=UPI00188F100B|nr:wall-associated receptor kinase 5-like [Triticum dicoccoides]